MDGLKNTLIITAGALVIGVVIGSLVAMIKYCGQDSRLLRPLCWLCSVYTTVIRGVPVVVQLLIFYFLILKSSDGLVVGIVTFGINSGAYVAELVRSGIAAVDPGQMEAGRSLGLNYITTMVVIIIPQAIRAVLPALGNEFIVLLKDTSLITVIGGKELLYAAQGIMNRTYEPMFPLFGVALMYLILVMIFTWLLAKFERRLAQSDR